MKKLLVYLSIFFIGCTPAPIAENPTTWFDLPGTTEMLLENMLTIPNPVEKVFVLNGEEETKVFSLVDSTFWAVELSSLLNTDLNSPQLRTSIQHEERLTDPASNLLINRYQSADNAKLFFRKLEIYYLETTDEIRKIKLELNGTNIISANSTNLVLSVNRYGEKLLIDSIHVTGFEKTIFQGERKYQSFTRRLRD